LPPFAGFFGKFYILMNSFQQGDWGLVLLGVLTSLLSAYYYLRIVKTMWFERIESREIFTYNSLFTLLTPRTSFYLYTTKPQHFHFSLYSTLFFLSAFLFLNKYLLFFSYQLAVKCSFPDVATWIDKHTIPDEVYAWEGKERPLTPDDEGWEQYREQYLEQERKREQEQEEWGLAKFTIPDESNASSSKPAATDPKKDPTSNMRWPETKEEWWALGWGLLLTGLVLYNIGKGDGGDTGTHTPLDPAWEGLRYVGFWWEDNVRIDHFVKRKLFPL
jgi:hypothetical protein